MYTLLKTKNEGLKEETLGFLTELLRSPSQEGNESKVAEIVKQEMIKQNYDKVYQDKAGNIIGIIYGMNAGPTMVLNSHLDTVILDRDNEWKFPPYAGHCENGRIYGAGASDCKGGIAAQVFAGALLKRSLLPLKGNLVVTTTTAEGNGRSCGVKYLLEETLPSFGLTPDYAILGEPTSESIYYGHDGQLEFNISIDGADPFEVNDTARTLGHSLSQTSGSEMTVTPARFENVNGRRKAVINGIKRLHSHETEASALNWVRHEASILTPVDGSLALSVEVPEREVQFYTGFVRQTSRITNAWATDPFHPLIERARQALAAANCDVKTGKWNLTNLDMGTAGSTFAAEHNIPTIGYGPGNEKLAHQINEYVELDAVTRTVLATTVIVHSLVGIPVFGWTSDDI